MQALAIMVSFLLPELIAHLYQWLFDAFAPPLKCQELLQAGRVLLMAVLQYCELHL